MKTKFTVLSIFAVSLSVSIGMPNELTNSFGLNIGTNDTAAEYSYGAVIGWGNTISDTGNYGVGAYNFLMVGDSNTILYGANSILLGAVNFGEYYSSLAVGSNDTTLAYNSIVAGAYNSSSIENGLVAGTNNSLWGIHQFALGRGLTNNIIYDDIPAIYLGQYNNASTQGSTPPIFVIGNGTSPSNTSNALEVLRNGDVNIPSGKLTLNGQPFVSSGAGNISFGDSGSLLSSPWKGGHAVGNAGYDKVVLGPLVSSFTGATIAAHNTWLNSWANLNIAGNNLIFRSNGETERARITSNGNFGIGTTNPVSPLTVVGNVSLLTNGDTSSFQILGNGATPSRRGISLDNDPQGAFNFYIHQWQGNSAFNFLNGYSNTNLMTLRANGRLGIGTINPSGKLEASATDTGGQNIFITKSDSGAPNQNNGSLVFDNYHLHDTGRYPGVEAGSIYFRFSQPTSGGIQNGAAIKGVSEEQNGNVTPTALTFSTVPSSGALFERMRIDSTGNVGIGTSSPKSTFQIGASDSLDIYDVTTQVRIFGKTTQSTNDETLFRLIRDHNSANYYPAVVDFKVGAYQGGGAATNYNPSTKLTFALKSASNFNEGANVDVMVLTSDGNVKIPKRQGDVGMGRFTSVLADK